MEILRFLGTRILASPFPSPSLTPELGNHSSVTEGNSTFVNRRILWKQGESCPRPGLKPEGRAEMATNSDLHDVDNFWGVNLSDREGEPKKVMQAFLSLLSDGSKTGRLRR